MKFKSTSIPEIILIEPTVFYDPRGFFLESFHQEAYTKAGITQPFVQNNLSCSMKNVLRGLHYQIQQAQGKLVQVVSGEIFDVAVDLRRSSASFGKWVGSRLSAANKLQIWIPPGFAHGFYTVSDRADVLYKVTDYYSPADERILLWNDPALAIEWPAGIKNKLKLSEKDLNGRLLSEAEVYP